MIVIEILRMWERLLIKPCYVDSGDGAHSYYVIAVDANRAGAEKYSAPSGTVAVNVGGSSSNGQPVIKTDWFCSEVPNFAYTALIYLDIYRNMVYIVIYI